MDAEFDYGTMFWFLNQGLLKEPATGLLSDDAKAAIVEAALSVAFPDPHTDKVKVRNPADWASIYAIGLEQVAEAEAVFDALGQRLAAIERMARLTAGELSGEEQDSLDGFCASLVLEDRA